MTHQQAKVFIFVAGAGMLVVGALMAIVAQEDRLRGHGTKLGIVGGILLILAMLN